MTKQRQKNRIIICLLCLLVMLFSAVGLHPVYAEVEKSSRVLAELSKDPTFDAEAYPKIYGSYNANVIQIAESTGGKLVVYFYVPGIDTVTLTDISLSATMGDSVKWEMYPLELLEADGVFRKYIVKDFAVKSDAVRIYDISEVFRLYAPGVDDEMVGGTLNKKAIPIAKRYTAITTSTGQVVYACEQTEVITVTAMYAGFLRFGANVYGKESCDAHFVAFSTDRPMEKLMQADITYMTQSYSYSSVYTFNFWLLVSGRGDEQTQVTEKYGDKTKADRTISADETGTYTESGWFASSYSWDRIQTVAAFKAQCNLTEGATNAVDGMDWVLRFTETEYSTSTSSSGSTSSYTAASGTRVSDITILRLKFQTSGVTYNLGTVSDVVTGDLIPDNPAGVEPQDPDMTWWDRLLKWLKDNWYWILLAVIGIILLPVIITFFPTVLHGLLLLLKGLWWVISAPFKFVYRKIRGE